MLSQPSCPPAARGPQPTRRMAVAALLLGTAATAAWQWQSGWGQQGEETTTPPTVGDDVCVVAPPTPYDPASGKPLAAPRDVPVDARCPVCGMYPARSRAWAGQVIFADGDAFFFDSPLSLMMYLGNVGHYTRGRTASAIVAAMSPTWTVGPGWTRSKRCMWRAPQPWGPCGRATCLPLQTAALPSALCRHAGGGFWVLTPSTRPCSPAWHHSAAVATGNTHTDDREDRALRYLFNSCQRLPSKRWSTI